MKNLFKKILLKLIACQKGAMDKVLVTLLMIIIAVVALIGLENWSSSKKDGLITKSNTAITSALNE